MSQNPNLEAFLTKLEGIIVHKYENCVIQSKYLCCKAASNQEVGSLKKTVFHINQKSLIEALEEIVKDVRFMLERRGTRIGKDHPSPGKIAGGNSLSAFKKSYCSSCGRVCFV